MGFVKDFIKGANHFACKVNLCSYKDGFSFIEASVLPLLALTRLQGQFMIQKAGDDRLAQKSGWFNLVNANPVFFHTYICAYANCTHIYTTDIHVLYA